VPENTANTFALEDLTFGILMLYVQSRQRTPDIVDIIRMLEHILSPQLQPNGDHEEVLRKFLRETFWITVVYLNNLMRNRHGVRRKLVEFLDEFNGKPLVTDPAFGVSR
jgi:hypothetical protein